MSFCTLRFFLIIELLPFSDADAGTLNLNHLPCDTERETRWFRVRELLLSRLPSYAGRLPFGTFQADLEMYPGLDAEVEGLGVQTIIFSSTRLEPPLRWSVCSLGAITLRAFGLMTLVATKRSEVWHAASDHVVLAMTAPWRDILLDGWPVFEILSILSRWASPHGSDHSKSSISTSPLHKGTQAAKEMPASRCDDNEHATTARVRRLLSNAWRSRDPASPALASDWEGSETFAETMLAGLGDESRNTEEGARGEACTWTEHPDTFLGGIVDTQIQGSVDMGRAMEICYLEPSCAGLTLEPTSNVGLQISLRKGEPFLDSSLVGEISYVNWCFSRFTANDFDAADASLSSCPLGRAVGLLATMLRRIKNSMGNFSPELLAEAQVELITWSTAVGRDISGHEAWASEWPLWELLGRVQQRVNLLRSVFTVNNPRPPLPLTASLQTALGFDDDAWRLVTSELNNLAMVHGADAVPSAVRKSIRCANGNECIGELYARLHLLLTNSGHLPLRDQIFLAGEDTLSRMFSERGKELTDGKQDDWDVLLDRKEGDEATLSNELDAFMPGGHPLQVDRRQLARFIHEVRPLLGDKPLGRCLEWDAPFLLIRAFKKTCRWNDVFSYSEPDPDEPLMGLPGRHEYTYGTRHYWGDLLHPDGLGIEPDTFDLILIPFVFEHVAQPFIGMKNIAYVLRSGGYVIWAAPMFQQYHGSPHDYWRYTPKGARSLAESVGLEVVKMHAPGDLSLVSGVMSGMLLPYWTEDKIFAESEPIPPEDSPRHPLNVFMLLRKPPRKNT